MSKILKRRIRVAAAKKAALCVSLAAVPAAYAQETDAVQMKPVIITGSLIPTAETVGAAPVATVSYETIERNGTYDILQSLKRITPVFSGNVNLGQEVNNGGFGEANIAIRNLPTLVLVNGHRLGNSSFSNGGFVDINAIPISIIDRIEVLKDGASAIYGSQAIGGVVNIITKTDFNGVDIGGRYGFATQKGSVAEYQAHIVAGTSNERSSFLGGLQFYHMDPLKTMNRPLGGLSFAELNARGQSGAVSYLSPSYDGEVQQGGARFVLAGHPLAAGLPGYNPAIVTPPILPGQTFSGATAVNQYNAAVVASGQPQPYLPTSALLNTPLLGTHGIQSQDRVNAFANGNHQLFEKRMEVYGEFMYANMESEGSLAPSPVVGLGVKQSNIDIPANNIYNPFGVALGPNGTLAPRIRSRFLDSGNRIFHSQTDYFHFTGGLRGEITEDYSYNFGYTYNRYDQVQFTKNGVNGAALDLALQPSSNPAAAAAGLSRLVGSNGAPVPMYNLFSVGGNNNAATVDAIRSTLFQTGLATEAMADFSITGTPFELPGGKVGFAVGGGFGSVSLENDFDGLTKIGKVPGLNASDPTKGTRDSWAVFAEVNVPLVAPDMEVPLIYSAELTAAGRFESFEPGGDSAVPKVGLRYQPIDQLTLRGSYSQSFVAPTTFQLFGGARVSNPFIGTAEGTVAQQTTSQTSNSLLEAIDAENYGAGIVYSPKQIKGLTLSLDYYNVSTENDIFRIGEQVMVDSLNALGSGSPWVNGYRFADGSRILTPLPNQVLSANWGSLDVPYANGAEQSTDGIEINANYTLETSTAGTFGFFVAANVIMSYEYQDPVVGGPYNYEGQYTDDANGAAGAQGTMPDYVINTGMNWNYRVGEDELGVTVTAQYIPEVDDLGTLHPGYGSNTSNDFTTSGAAWTIESWFRVDMQVSYEFGKFSDAKRWYDKTRLAIGVNNISDEDPPQIASGFEDNTDKSTYDYLGRLVYFTISKKF